MNFFLILCLFISCQAPKSINPLFDKNFRQAEVGTPDYIICHPEEGSTAYKYFFEIFNMIEKNELDLLVNFSTFIYSCLDDISFLFQRLNGQKYRTIDFNLFLFIKNFKNTVTLDNSGLGINNEDDEKDELVSFRDSKILTVFLDKLSKEEESEACFRSFLFSAIQELNGKYRYILDQSKFKDKERADQFRKILNMYFPRLDSENFKDFVSQIPSESEKKIINFLENLSDKEIESSKQEIFDLLCKNKKGFKIIVEKISEYHVSNLEMLLNLITNKNIQETNRKRPREKEDPSEKEQSK